MSFDFTENNEIINYNVCYSWALFSIVCNAFWVFFHTYCLLFFTFIFELVLFSILSCIIFLAPFSMFSPSFFIWAFGTCNFFAVRHFALHLLLLL